MPYAIVAGITAVALIVWHEWHAQRQWRRSLKESKARAIGRKLEQPAKHPGQYDEAQWDRIRRNIATAPLRDNGRPIVTLVKGGAR